MCHNCGHRRSAVEVCKVCGSWRLTPLGIGIESVAAEINQKYPETNLIQVDADTTKNASHVEKAIATFVSRPGNVLLGTETALLHLRDKIDHSAVVSMDSLFSLPDFRIQEKIIYILLRLREISTRSILVQTRRPEEKVFEFGLKGNLSDFYRAELEQRKQFEYPPFTVLIKLTIEGKKDDIAKQMSVIQSTLLPYEVDIFPAFTSSTKGNFIIHGLTKIVASRWADIAVVQKLRLLPPNVHVRIQPESLL
jgi:primosomal protein N' (replication factor Y)